MPVIPWTPAPASQRAASADQPTPAVVMASRFRLTSRRHTVRMLRRAMKVREQVLAAPGALGVSLVARPLRREYLTLSSWTDRASLDAFVRTSPHREAMAELHPLMADADFTFWELPAAPPPAWADAEARLTAGGRAKG